MSAEGGGNDPERDPDSGGDSDAGRPRSLLWWGLAVFAIGVAIAEGAGEEGRSIGLGVELTGVAMLFFNMLRSRQRVRGQGNG